MEGVKKDENSLKMSVVIGPKAAFLRILDAGRGHHFYKLSK
jgi:hypothetical protein